MIRLIDLAIQLVAIGVILLGAYSYPTSWFPTRPAIDLPTIVVSAALPGASPETMAATVATPLERRLGRLAGVTEISSSSTVGRTHRHPVQLWPGYRRRCQ